MTRHTTQVPLPASDQVRPSLVPAFPTAQVMAVTDLTRSQLVSLAQLRALRPDLPKPQGTGRALLYTAANLVQLSVLQRVLTAGVSMREGLLMLRKLDTAVVGCDDTRWKDETWLVLQFDARARRAARSPASLWDPATLAWLTARHAWLGVAWVAAPSGQRPDMVVRIVRPWVSISDVAASVKRTVLSLLTIDLAAIGQRLGPLIAWAAQPPDAAVATVPPVATRARPARTGRAPRRRRS